MTLAYLLMTLDIVYGMDQVAFTTDISLKMKCMTRPSRSPRSFVILAVMTLRRRGWRHQNPPAHDDPHNQLASKTLTYCPVSHASHEWD